MKLQWPYVRRTKIEVILREIDVWREGYERLSGRERYVRGLNFATRYVRMKLWGNPLP